MQQTTFPLTILLKNGKLQVISTLTSTLIMPLLKRVLEELEVSHEDRYYAPETEVEEDGTPNSLFEAFESIDADAICLLTQDGQFIFILNSAYEINETAKYQRFMREKLVQYTHREEDHD